MIIYGVQLDEACAHEYIDPLARLTTDRATSPNQQYDLIYAANQQGRKVLCCLYILLDICGTLGAT